MENVLLYVVNLFVTLRLEEHAVYFYNIHFFTPQPPCLLKTIFEIYLGFGFFDSGDDGSKR